MIQKLMFGQFRIAILYILIFLGFFLPSRYERRKTILILAGCFLFTGAMDYRYLIEKQNGRISAVFTLAEIVVLQSTPFIIGKYRDFRAMFVGFSAATYVLGGCVVSSVLYIAGAGVMASLLCQTVFQTALLGLLVWKIRDGFLGSQESGELQWGKLCLIPAMFYAAVHTVSMWPSNIYEIPSNLVGVLCIVGIMIISYIMLFEIFERNRRDGELRRGMEYLENYASRLKHEADAVWEKEQEMAVMRHDLRHYSILVNSYLEEGKKQEIRALLQEMDEHIGRTRTVRYCENLAVNGILNYCARQAEEKGIAFQGETEIPQRMGLNEFEFATVVSNLLENAVNAADLVEEPGRRFVRISARGIKEKLILEISNGCVKEPELSKLTGYPLSEGGARHGYGMKSVRAFVEKNGAMFDFNVEKGIFYVRMLVNIGERGSREI